jgi:hypothetical protein
MKKIFLNISFVLFSLTLGFAQVPGSISFNGGEMIFTGIKTQGLTTLQDLAYPAQAISITINAPQDKISFQYVRETICFFNLSALNFGGASGAAAIPLLLAAKGAADGSSSSGGPTPVPVGAATAANQATEITKLSNIETNTATLVRPSDLTTLSTVQEQQTQTTALNNLNTKATQTNTALATIQTNTANNATVANQATANATLTSIDSKLTTTAKSSDFAPISTAAKQDEQTTKLAAIEANITGLVKPSDLGLLATIAKQDAMIDSLHQLILKIWQFKNNFDAKDFATNTDLLAVKTTISQGLQDKATVGGQVAELSELGEIRTSVNNLINNSLTNAKEVKQDAEIAKSEEIRTELVTVNTNLAGLAPASALTVAAVATQTNTAQSVLLQTDTNVKLDATNTKLDASNAELASINSKINDVSTAANQVTTHNKIDESNVFLKEIRDEVVKPTAYNTPTRTVQSLNAGAGVIDIDGSLIREWTVINISAANGGKMILISFDGGTNWGVIEPGQTFTETQTINPANKKITDPSTIKIDVLDSAYVLITTLLK